MTHPKTVEADGPAPLRFPAEQLERHCCSVVAEHLRTAAAGTIEAIAEAGRLASAIEAANPAGRMRIFRDHVAQVIAGEAVLTLVLHEGQRLERSIAKLRHGNDARLAIGEMTDGPVANPQLFKLLCDAHGARQLALKKPTLALPQLATEFGRSPERFKRLLRLSYLAPKLVESILSGEQPPELTSVRLQSLDGLPRSWAEQHAMLLS